MNNEKQIVVTFVLYSNDSGDNVYPPNREGVCVWPKYIYKYIVPGSTYPPSGASPKVFTCPSDTQCYRSYNITVGQNYVSGPKTTDGGYTYDRPTHHFYSRCITSIKNPSSLIFFLDSAWTVVNKIDNGTSSTQPFNGGNGIKDGVERELTKQPITHSYGTNYSFFGGHVKWYRWYPNPNLFKAD